MLIQDKLTVSNTAINSKGKSRLPERIPSSFHERSSYVNNSFEKPLKSTSSDLAFKGFSLATVNKAYNNLSPAIERYSKEFGDEAGKFLKKQIDELAETTDLLKVKDGVVNITEQSMFVSLKDSLLYPIIGMPADLFEFALKSAKKLPGLADSKKINDLLNSEFLLKRRLNAANKTKIASISKILESAADPSNNLFKGGHRRLNPLISDYSTDKERGLNRLVTGTIPAFFLANDAYNLTRLMNDNPEEAKKEKARRFNQEVARVTFTAYTTFVTLGALSKVINKNQYLSALVSTAIVVVAEAFSRTITHKPITFISKEKAQQLNEKYGSEEDKKESEKIKKEQESGALSIKNAYSPIVFKNSSVVSSSAFNGFSPRNANQVIFSDADKKAQKEKKDKSFWVKAGAVFGGLFVLGFASNKFKASKLGEAILTPIKKGYDHLIKEDDLISRQEFSEILKRLKDNGFETFASKYQDIVKDQTSEMINLGRKNRKILNPLINDVLMFPVRTLWKWSMIPFNLLNNTVGKLLPKAAKEVAKEVDPSKAIKDSKKMLSNSISFIKKIPQDADFKKVFNEKILTSFDETTKSNYSNHNLAKITKLSTSTATSYFLVADNYNLVMQKTQDKDKAVEKGKERAIQRGYGVVYGTFLVTFLNNIFKVPYSKSLFNMSLVGVIYALVNETLTRFSTGLPIKEQSRDQILEVEKKNLESEGLKGKYFRLMKTITGKKQLSENQKAKNAAQKA